MFAGYRVGQRPQALNRDRARTTIELADMYVVQPQAALWFGYDWSKKGSPLPEGFHYASDNNTEWLSVEEIQAMVSAFENETNHGGF